MTVPTTIQTLRDLATLLSSERASVSGVVETLGTHPVDLRANVVVQEPRLEGILRASVGRQGGEGDVPGAVSIELAVPILLRDLEAAFGGPKIVTPDHPGQLRSAVFSIAEPEHEFDVRLIGAVEAGATRSITLRREVRLTP